MIIAYCLQDIAFLVAKKSMGLPVVGYIARKMKCIPVERPQDLAKAGTGKLLIKSDTNISGVGTCFKKELMPGDTIKLQGSSVRFNFKIIVIFISCLSK